MEGGEKVEKEGMVLSMCEFLFVDAVKCHAFVAMILASHCWHPTLRLGFIMVRSCGLYCIV